VCSCGGDRTKRHNLLRNHSFHYCESAGLNSELEHPGLLPHRPPCGSAPENGGAVSLDSNNWGPADVYLPRWRRGGPAACGFAVTSGSRHNIVRSSALDGSSVVSAYEA
jgi:hypothetical protein